jgi:hypothetical protein|tara:strand:- start:172 stop:327 length:156 start_codon:yes stop_codon:yes gene_type:complete
MKRLLAISLLLITGIVPWALRVDTKGSMNGDALLEDGETILLETGDKIVLE